MELRRQRRVPKAFAIERHAPVLWPHACFSCRKSWKLSEESKAACPSCRAPLAWMGRAFKPPRSLDTEQWEKVRRLWEAGFRFSSHERGRDAELYPERLREVEDFIARNPDHAFRIKAPA